MFVCSQKSHPQVPGVTVRLHFFCPIQQACPYNLYNFFTQWLLFIHSLIYYFHFARSQPWQTSHLTPALSFTMWLALWFLLGHEPTESGFLPVAPDLDQVVGSSPALRNLSSCLWSMGKAQGGCSCTFQLTLCHRAGMTIPGQSLWTTQASCEWEVSSVTFKFITSSEKCLKIAITVKKPSNCGCGSIKVLCCIPNFPLFA